MAKQTSSRSSSTPAKRKPTSEAPAKAKQVVAEATAPTGLPAQSASNAQPVSTPSHEQIARRAYELYQTRAYAEGSALHDWLRAESDLRAS